MKKNPSGIYTEPGDRFSLSLKFFGLFVVLFLFMNAGAQTYGEYTLYSTKSSTKAYLIDMNGSVYHTWTFASNKKTGYSSYLLPGGVILRAVEHQGNTFSGGGMTGEIQKVDWDGNVVWDYVYSTTQYCSHHDICPMPNGNVLLIAYESKTATEVSQAGCSQSITMWPDKIVEIQPSGTSGGTVVWEWHVWDHLCQSLYPAKDNYVTSIVMHPELLNINYQTQKDWMHSNGIDYNESLDQIVFSSHYLNEFYVIDHSTTTAEAAGHSEGNSGKGGDFLYRWGNPAAYQASGTTDFNVVHDAHWVPPDCPKANYLGAFNNKGGTGQKSCVDLVNPPYDGYTYTITLGQAFEPPTYTWRHTYSGQATQDEGSAQSLPNGNTLMCISQSGYIYEIDSNQNVVWSKTIGGDAPNARRYTACYVNSSLSVTASASPSSICTGDSSQLAANASGGSGYTYLWTSNPAGYNSTSQNPVVYPAETTEYIVTVTSGTCFATDSITIMVNPVPKTPEITQHGDTLFSSSASGNQWYLNGIPVSTQTQFLIPSSNGSYQVQVTSENGCVSEMSEEFIVNWVGTEELIHGLKGIVFPNPTNGKLFINASSIECKEYDLSLFNSQGKLILRKQNQEIIDVTGFPEGIYYYLIKTISNKLIKGKIILIR
jgi:hypothetical protein